MIYSSTSTDTKIAQMTHAQNNMLDTFFLVTRFAAWEPRRSEHRKRKKMSIFRSHIRSHIRSAAGGRRGVYPCHVMSSMPDRSLMPIGPRIPACNALTEQVGSSPATQTLLAPGAKHAGFSLTDQADSALAPGTKRREVLLGESL